MLQRSELNVMGNNGGGQSKSVTLAFLPLSGNSIKSDMIPLPITIEQNSHNPSLPLPLEVFANGPESPVAGQGEASNG
jgi:hypothetical protein